MALIEVLPDHVEKKIDAVLSDVQLKLHALDPAVRQVPQLVSDFHALVNEARAELAAIKRLRERWQAAAPDGQGQ